jgi:hypothetical protein
VLEEGSELMLSLLQENPELAKYAGEPYHFMEYLIYKLNSEAEEDKLEKLFSRVGQLYQGPYSADLFR